MEREFHFSDCIEVVTDEYDSVLYNPVYSEKFGLYLYSEDDMPIKYLSLIKSKMFIFYLNGTIKQFDATIISINVSDELFSRRIKSGILGELLKYDYDSSVIYDLDNAKAFDYEDRMLLIRKRSL